MEKIMTMQYTTDPQVEIIKGLNLATVELTNVQVTKLLLVALAQRVKYLL
jgi:hypothetical protein